MQKRLIIDSQQLGITLQRLCHQVIENHGDFSNSVIIGLQPKGVFLAQRMTHILSEILSKPVPLGLLDISFNRDDYRRREIPSRSYTTEIPFVIEDKNVLLVDDVLYTGRSVRSALEAIIAFGRPRKVELLTLIDRLYTRDFPIEPNYVGQRVNTIDKQRVLVELTEQEGIQQDTIWLITKNE